MVSWWLHFFLPGELLLSSILTCQTRSLLDHREDVVQVCTLPAFTMENKAWRCSLLLCPITSYPPEYDAHSSGGAGFAMCPWDLCLVLLQVELLASGPLSCPISLESPPRCPQITPCGHIFSFPSIMQHLAYHGGPQLRWVARSQVVWE